MYRTNAYVHEPVKRALKVSVFAYVLGCAVMVAAGGGAAEYLSRDLPEDHVSCSGFFSWVAFMILAAYFAFRGICRLREQ